VILHPRDRFDIAVKSSRRHDQKQKNSAGDKAEK